MTKQTQNDALDLSLRIVHISPLEETHPKHIHLDFSNRFCEKKVYGNLNFWEDIFKKRRMKRSYSRGKPVSYPLLNVEHMHVKSILNLQNVQS